MIPYLTVKDLNLIVIPNHSSENQKAIANILGTLDDKIELSQKLNQTLEEIAKAIFKSLFVDFDPVRAKLCILIRNLLKRCKYPPDEQKGTVEIVLWWAEVLSKNMVA